jgi:hypothetical protein
MRLQKNILLSGIAALTLFMAACGGGGGNGPTPPAAISVTLSPAPPTSIVISKTATLTAVVANDTAAAGVTWKATCGSTDCGSFSPASTPGNSGTTIYTAPATIPTGNTVVVIATSVTDSTKSASATITVTGTPVISVAISNPPANLVVNTPATLTAVVSEDSAAAGVTWSVACGSAACGTFNPTTSPGNNATTSYTAPAAIPAGNAGNVTVTATSVTDNTKSATATITILATPPAVLADGTYIYHVSGENGSDGPYTVAGAFTVQNAVITGGEQDWVDLNGDGGTNALVPNTSSLTVESSGNIQIVLDSGVNGAGVNGVVTLRGTLVSGTRALISEFDASAAGTGSLDLQTGKAAPAGGYAFNLFGADGAAQASLLVIGGVLDITGTTIATSTSVFDYSDGGTLGQGAQFSSGAVSAPDQYGRITINLTPTTASGASPFGLIGYIVGTNRIELVENNTDALQGSLGGSALGQGAKTNAFTTADVTGASYAFIANGADNINGLANFAGAFALNSNGSVSGVVAYNDGNNRQGPQITGGTWTIDPTGRVTLSDITLGGANIGNGPYSFQLYVDGNGNAFELGNDAFQESTGPSFVQTGPLTAGQFAIAAQGFAATGNQQVWAGVGSVAIDASFNWNGFTDYNVFTGTPLTNVPLTGTTNTGSGLFELTGLSALANPLGPGSFGYYPISATKVLAIELDDNEPGGGVQLGIFVIEGITTQ